MTHKWYPASGGGLLAAMWLANPIKVALMKPTYVPNPDLHKVWADVAAQELTAGSGYTAGGQALASKATPYNAAADRTDFQAADSVWGPGATFTTHFALVYDDSGSKPLWSIVDFEEDKAVVNGVFTIDWAAAGLLYTIPVP